MYIQCTLLNALHKFFPDMKVETYFYYSMILKHEIYLDGYLRKNGSKTMDRYRPADFFAPKISRKFSTQMEKYISDVFGGDERAAIDYLNYAKRFMTTQDFFADL